MRRTALLAIVLLALAPGTTPSAQQASAPELRPTNHPKLPSDLSDFWMVPEPSSSTPPQAELAIAVKLIGQSNYDAAYGILSRAGLQTGPLAHYITYFRGVAELNGTRPAEALKTFQRLSVDAPVGYLAEAAAIREAESQQALGNAPAAVAIYERLSAARTSAPADVLMRLARAAEAAGDDGKALAAYSRIYFEYPTGAFAKDAGTRLATMPGRPALTAGSARYPLEMARAQRLFDSRNFKDARAAFEALNRVARSEDRGLIALRLAECDFYLKRWVLARTGVKPFVDKGPRQSEALFFYGSALRHLNAIDAYRQTVDRLVADFPGDRWTEEALNDLASYYIVQDDDLTADGQLRELYERFPKGRFAERAAWKIGWLAYKSRRYADTVRYFEEGAASFPRSDYRPAWLYWSARAHEALKEAELAQAGYALLLTDYSNTYYGRLAVPRPGSGPRLSPSALRAALVPPAPPPAPPNRQTIRALLALELYDQALDELRYAQLTWGDSPSIQATLGFVLNRKGEVRAGINAVKRAYPQYMTAGGEKLPVELLKLIYPIQYWPQIQRYSAERGLDPYMMAALILQESNFDPSVRSSANAYGLMQLLPSTGRHYARTLKLTGRFSVSLLKTAEPNLRMGTAYFSDLMKMFGGGAHFALASYNAGESRVRRWQAESGAIPRDEFIEDIPFFETSNYVKRILGTTEDYRRLYGAKPMDAGQG